MTKKFGHVEKYKSAIDCVLCYTDIAGGEDYTKYTYIYVIAYWLSLWQATCVLE